MTYSDPDRPSRSVGEGFRVEPEYRKASGSPEGYTEEDFDEGYPAPPTVPMDTATARRVVTAAELDGVFDDPEQGALGRDRLLVHFIWEAVLLIGAGAMAF